MLSHGMTFNFVSAKVCSPAKIETYFSYYKDIWIAVSDYYISFLLNCALSIDSYTSFDKFYNYIAFSLQINAVILLLNCLVLIHYIYFFSLKH